MAMEDAAELASSLSRAKYQPAMPLRPSYAMSGTDAREGGRGVEGGGGRRAGESFRELGGAAEGEGTAPPTVLLRVGCWVRGTELWYAAMRMVCAVRCRCYQAGYCSDLGCAATAWLWDVRY
eukprot:908012-Rhodomonas_salina.3